MNKLLTQTLLLIGIVLVGVQSVAAKGMSSKDLTVSAQGWYGYDIERSRPNLTSYGYMNYEVALGIQTSPERENPFAEAFGFPLIDIGVSVARVENFQFSDQTRFGNLYSAYGSFERSLWRTRRFSAGYLLNFGVTYNPDKYDPVNNPGNNWLSSPFMAYFGAGVFGKVHIGKRWEVGANFMFRHFSNGRLSLPNEALNGMGVGVFARYRMADYDYKKYKTKYGFERNYDRGMHYMIVVGGGLHTCMAEWNAYVESQADPVKKLEAADRLKAHPKFSLGFDALYRYSMRYATGLGVDLFYSSNMKSLEASDRVFYGNEAVDNSPGYNPLSVGIAVVQEVYWGNFAVHVAVGAYPYRHKGVNGAEAKAAGDRERGWHYEKAGFRYYFPKLGDTFVGFAIKSHSIKAEYLEFSIGVRL
ncbi:MAG: acyloxyacyl hydrolase [Alistipes sp.]|nr:acyloxyacyl hydrolase [Alistipes sp.]